MGYRRELVIGKTRLGRPIDAVHFAAAEYSQPRPTAVLFGAIHGDEAVTQLMLERLADELVERPPGRDVWIVPCVNPDGVVAGTRNNAANVDLNRNFAAANWVPAHRHGYHPGDAPEDQPETRALVDLIDRVSAHRLVAVHATYRMINFDGCGRVLAEEMAERCGYPLEADMGYPTPGSFGSKYGIDRGLEVITIESPYVTIEEQAWHDMRTALRWAVDLPE